MNGKKKLVAGLILAAVLIALIGGVAWCLTQYDMVDFHFYPKNAAALDLRDRDISVEHYNKLHSKMPGCQIRWNIPFQGTTYPDETTDLTVDTLSSEDVAVLDAFTRLETVHAEGCRDYAQLLALEDRRPEITVLFLVSVDGTDYPGTAAELRVGGITQEELALLPYLRKLTGVVVTGDGSGENLAQLQAYCQENGLSFNLEVGGKKIPGDTKAVKLIDAEDGDLELLPLLTSMQTLHLVNPKASAERVLALDKAYPQVQVTWEQEICGKSFAREDTEIDLSDTTIESLEQVEQGMAYFPEAEQVFLGEQKMDNEEIAAYRERVREQYKVVWIVRCGEKLPTRTDATSFMPSRDGVGNFKDADSYNLRYCEDMIAIDVGHMDVRNIEFVAYMPNLKYLILAHTGVRDITPISNCKNLVFLELDWSPIEDYTPLQGCTALEDLNIGKYGADVAPICEMPWLKNVWCVFRPGAAGRIAMALPDTHVVASGNATVSSGWRNLPNYYAMRDALNMFYMKW